MHICELELKKMAELAYIEIPPENITDFTKDLNAILSFAQILSSINVQGITPLLHPLHMLQRLRTDAITESSNTEKLAHIAPDFSEGLYWVPKVIEVEK